MRRSHLIWPTLAAAAVVMGGCAYVTVTPLSAANRATAKGIRIYSPKPYVVVNQTGVSTIYLPDCAQAYALTFGTVLAKNDLSLEIKDGMLSKLDSKEDSTVIGTNFLSAVSEATKVGKSLGTAFSGKAAGGTNSLTVFEGSCVNGQLTLRPVAGLAGLAVTQAPPTPPADDAPADGEAGTPPPPGAGGAGDRP